MEYEWEHIGYFNGEKVYHNQIGDIAVEKEHKYLVGLDRSVEEEGLLKKLTTEKKVIKPSVLMTQISGLEMPE